QQHLGVTRHHGRDATSLLLGETLLREHERDFGLSFARSLRDFVALVVDLGVEDLALPLAADVLAGGHREHAGEATRDAGDDDGECLTRGAGDRRDDGKRRNEAVLEPEDDLPDLAQKRAGLALLGEVIGEPGAVRSVRGRVERWSRRGLSHVPVRFAYHDAPCPGPVAPAVSRAPSPTSPDPSTNAMAAAVDGESAARPVSSSWSASPRASRRPSGTPRSVGPAGAKGPARPR